MPRTSTPVARRSLSYQRRFSSSLGWIALLASQTTQEIQMAMRTNPTTYWRGERRSGTAASLSLVGPGFNRPCHHHSGFGVS